MVSSEVTREPSELLSARAQIVDDINPINAELGEARRAVDLQEFRASGVLLTSRQQDGSSIGAAQDRHPAGVAFG